MTYDIEYRSRPGGWDAHRAGERIAVVWNHEDGVIYSWGNLTTIQVEAIRTIARERLAILRQVYEAQGRGGAINEVV